MQTNNFHLLQIPESGRAVVHEQIRPNMLYVSIRFCSDSRIVHYRFSDATVRRGTVIQRWLTITSAFTSSQWSAPYDVSPKINNCAIVALFIWCEARARYPRTVCQAQRAIFTDDRLVVFWTTKSFTSNMSVICGAAIGKRLCKHDAGASILA